MKKTILLCLLIFIGSITFSQDKGIKAQVYYTNAEEYFNQGTNIGAEKCFDELENAEKTLGTTNSKILYLKIKALDKLFQEYYWYDLELAIRTFFKITDTKTYPTDKYAEVVNIENKRKISEGKKNKQLSKYFTPEYKKTDSALYYKALHYKLLGRRYEYRDGYKNRDLFNVSQNAEIENNDDYKYALYLFKDLGNRNYIDALYEIGSSYASGLGVKKNGAEAIYWYSKAANLNNVDAMLRLVFIYRYGPDLDESKKDILKAKEWCMKAVQLGSLIAMKDLGDLCLGEGNHKAAFDWYTKASESGYAGASIALGDLYRHGNGVKKDGVKALEIYNNVLTTSTDKYDKSSAMNKIGLLYEFGSKDIKKNKQQADEWYSKAKNSL